MLALLWHNGPLFLIGTLHTLLLIFTAALLGIIFAIGLTLCSISKYQWLNKAASLYIFIIRGTPFLLQLYIIYYGSMQFHCIVDSPLAIIFKSAMVCAVMALTLNTAAYTSVLLTGAMNNLNPHDSLSAQQLGLSKFHIFKSIILPQVFFNILPMYSNELIMLMKCTAIASSITILDIMGVTQQIIGMTYQTIPCLIIAAILYCLISAAIMWPSKWLYYAYCQRIGAVI